MDRKKIEEILSWLVPKPVKELRGFLGLARYYMGFIKNFGSIAKPLTNMLMKGGFEWSQESTIAFEQLKEITTNAPLLALLAFDIEFIVETNASENGVRVLLMQLGIPIAT